MRLYFDLNKKDPVLHDLCKLACNDNNIDICNAANLPGTPMKNATEVFAMNWRFFPTLDPQVRISGFLNYFFVIDYEKLNLVRLFSFMLEPIF